MISSRSREKDIKKQTWARDADASRALRLVLLWFPFQTRVVVVVAGYMVRLVSTKVALLNLKQPQERLAAKGSLEW